MPIDGIEIHHGENNIALAVAYIDDLDFKEDLFYEFKDVKSFTTSVNNKPAVICGYPAWVEDDGGEQIDV